LFTPFFICFLSLRRFYAYTKQKPPLQSKGGQEVRNNHWNCVLIQYIHIPPDPRPGDIFSFIQKKRHRRAMQSCMNASETGFDTPSVKNPTDRRILSVLKKWVNK